MRNTYAIPEVTEHGDVLTITRAGGSATTIESGSMVNDKSTSQNNGNEVTAGGTSDPETHGES